jgi:uncharacterized protein DUF4342
MTTLENRHEEFPVTGKDVTGEDVAGRVRRLVREGNVSRLSLKRRTGETILEVPLTAGVAVATAGAALAPVLVAIGAVTALSHGMTLGVERRPTEPVHQSTHQSPVS